MIRLLLPITALVILGVVIAARLIGPPLPDVGALSKATHLIVVETDGFDSAQARMRTYERRRPKGTWRPTGLDVPVTVGRAGLGWGHTFRHHAKDGEPIKKEGDKRAPIGIFALGPSFGFQAQDAPSYMQLTEGQHFCVDDRNSPHYGHIVTQAEAGEGTSGERMWSIDLYRHGIVVDYPTSWSMAAGSCIFLHVWRAPGVPTVGCVAAAEPVMADLQRWVAASHMRRKPWSRAAIIIAPKQVRPRLGVDLP